MTTQPRLLDLFCGAGGAAMGYHRAGFEVVGVDNRPQPNYPFEFIEDDALAFLREYGWTTFDAIHASPPCQRFTAYRRRGSGVGENYPDLISAVRDAARFSALPYVIENVPGSPVAGLVQLCGSSFGLDVRRHRLFEVSFPMLSPPCAHGWQPQRFAAATNRAENSRRTVEVGVWRIPVEVQQRAMGIDWMTRDELSQAIPPTYTQFIGEQLLDHLAVLKDA